MKILTKYLILLFIMILNLKASENLKVEPPNWWTHFDDRKLELMVYKEKIGNSKILKIFGLIIFLQVISITSSNLSIKFDGMHYINFVPSIFCLICSCLIIFQSKRLVNGDK